ncbi:MAG TPA: Hint domain-containing protein [Acetobacteraceae bacterium]|nr:Hint domain-containing protein [Acetobacteraceae bacterium]
MAASATYIWNSGTGGIWTVGSNWAGGVAPPTSGSGANGSLIDLSTATSGPITLGQASVNAGAISITANATLDIASGQTLQAAAAATAGDYLAMNAGTVDLSGGILKYGTINVGGTGEIFGYGTLTDPGVGALGATLTTGLNGLIVADVNGGGGNGTLYVAGSANSAVIPVSGNYQIDTGAVLQFGVNTELLSASEPVINFTNSTGVLNVANATTLWTVSGTDLTLNARIENPEVGTTVNSSASASQIVFNIGAGDTISQTAIIGGSTLEAIVNTTTYLFDTTASLPLDHVDWTNSGSLASIWVDTNPCYVAGTRILTVHGEVAVEDLAEGDMVVTLSGDTRLLRPVTWIGQRWMNLRQHPQPNLVAPVRVLRHAFGQSLPARDLLVSPDHCLFVAGRLVPAKLLINDMTIVQERETAAVHYYHVELDQHAVMFAEGLPAESYLDTGNRAMFANTGLAMVLHPEFAVNASLKCWETDSCASLAVSQEAVQPIWQGLAERAGSLGYQHPNHATTDDPELRLVADGHVIRPLSSDANRYVFTLPAGVSSVRLVSRASVPSYFEAYRDDWRQLGVAIRRIVVRDSAGLTEIPPDHPGLTQGWHAVERDDATMWRWMNGDAVLPIRPTESPAMVEVQVGIAMRHIVENVAEGRLAA